MSEQRPKMHEEGKSILKATITQYNSMLRYSNNNNLDCVILYSKMLPSSSKMNTEDVDSLLPRNLGICPQDYRMSHPED
jgi:hypothetical protein